MATYFNTKVNTVIYKKIRLQNKKLWIIDNYYFYIQFFYIISTRNWIVKHNIHLFLQSIENILKVFLKVNLQP